MAQRWEPRDEPTPQEKILLKTVEKTKKLFGFLRLHRRQLFDDAFQDELAAVYRGTGAGKPAHPPALMAMVVLLQAYTGSSDAEAVQQCVVDLRWQMVLDCLGATKPLFSQGALHDFRQRLIRHDLDRRLLERTAEIATTSGAFDRKKLPKTLRLAIDSKPLQGAARVEDTINLLGHAAREVVRCVASLLGEDIEVVARSAGIPLVLESSTKRALDTDWTDPKQKRRALDRLIAQLRGLLQYVHEHLPEQASEPPLVGPLEALRQVLDQDLEPDPDDPRGKRLRIRQGVAKDRRISIRDPEMRHGRKSRSKSFNGFKQHIAIDVDRKLILACAVARANGAETEATPALRADIERYGVGLSELHIDRGYVSSELVRDAVARGIEVLSKPRRMPPNHGLFTKHDFRFDLRKRTVTCPAGEVERFIEGQKIAFDAATCRGCKLRTKCTRSEDGRGLQIAEDELLQQLFLRRVVTRAGRERLRERVAVEHRLAHLKHKQGDRARYVGTRKNVFDLRRTAAVLNLEALHREETLAA
jgi:hypothetical protein